jgi:hypothetical protein
MVVYCIDDILDVAVAPDDNAFTINISESLNRSFILDFAIVMVGLITQLLKIIARVPDVNICGHLHELSRPLVH